MSSRSLNADWVSCGAGSKESSLGFYACYMNLTTRLRLLIFINYKDKDLNLPLQI